MKAKIIQSGFYNGNGNRFVALDVDRDTLTFESVVKDPQYKGNPLCFKVKRGLPWFDKQPISVYLSFADYIAID
jgi:hypothetical protein